MKNRIYAALLVIATSFQIQADQVTTHADLGERFGDDMLVTPKGELLISGGYNKRTIVKIGRNGEVSTFAEDLPGPVGMGYDSMGNLYVANYTGNSITKILPNGSKVEFASGLDGPAGLYVSSDEIYVTLYGAKFSGKGASIIKFDLEGKQSLVAKGQGLMDVIGIDMDEEGVIYVNNYKSGQIFKVINGKVKPLGIIENAHINQIAYSKGAIYVPSPNFKKVFRFDVNGKLEVYAGDDKAEVVDGQLDKARFHFPNSVAINDKGNEIYILDGVKGLIRRIDLM